MRRVVVTGLGTVNSLGKNVNEYWNNIKENKLGFSFIDKFIASHTLIVTPFKGLDISLGESIIYDEELEFLYLMPIPL